MRYCHFFILGTVASSSGRAAETAVTAMTDICMIDDEVEEVNNEEKEGHGKIMRMMTKMMMIMTTI